MFSYNAHSRRDNFLSALRAIGFEASIITILLLFLLGVLSYFNIISISTFMPFLSNMLPKEHQVAPNLTVNSNDPNVTLAVVKSHAGNGTQSGQMVVSTIQVNVVIDEVSTLAGVYQSKNGELQYEYKLKVHDPRGSIVFFFEKNDLPNITVVELLSGTEKNINFSQLKAGDNIQMNSTYNPKTKELFKLKIIRK